MGHVDDAHQAVGDREPQRRQQQDRAEAEAREQGEPDLGRAQARLISASEAGRRCARSRRLPRSCRPSAASASSRAAAAPADRRSPRARVRPWRAARARCSSARATRRPAPGSPLISGSASFAIARSTIGSTSSLSDPCSSLAAASRSPRSLLPRRQGGQRGIDLAANAVVDDDRLEVRGSGPGRLTGGGVGQLAAGDDDGALAVVDQR